MRRRGKRVLFWADVASGANLFEKYPQLASGLPEGTIPVPWHYHDEKDYSRMLEPFRKANVPQVIGTGIWAWDTIAPDFHITFANIDGFLRDGRKHGTLGIVNTNWADDAQILYRMTQPGVAYGAIAAWQRGPYGSRRLLFELLRRSLSRRPGGWHCGGTRRRWTTRSRRWRQRSARRICSGSGTILWRRQALSRVRAHIQEMRQARLKAEEAQERLQAVASQYPESLPSLLLGARLLDYAGMKFLYAVEIADIYTKLDASATRADASFWLGREASDRNHSRIGDLMDLITELRDVYQAQWQAENTPYRLGAALGRFNAEYEYWRRLQSRLWDVRRTFQEGKPLPPLDSLRR